MKLVLRTLLIVVLLAGVAGGGFYLYRTRLAPAAEGDGETFTQVVTVRRGAVRETISVSGSLDAVRRKTLQFEKARPGTPLQSLLVKAGDTVAEGDVLATIEPLFYEQAFTQAQVNLRAAEERLAKLRQPPSDVDRRKADLAVRRAELQLAQAEGALAKLRRPDLAELREKVAAAETQLTQAKRELQATQAETGYEDSLRELRERELAAGAEQARLAAESYTDVYQQDRLRIAQNAFADAVDERIRLETDRAARLLRARLAVRRAERAAADARKALNEAQAGASTSTQAALALSGGELAVQEARLTLSQAREARARLEAGADPLELARARAEVDEQRAEVATAQAAVEQAQLVAPFDGTVLETSVVVGGAVGPDVAVLTLADITELQVLAVVDESRVRRFKPDQSAEITFEALPLEIFTGRVKSVPLQGKTVEQVRVFSVPFALDDPSGLPGQMGISASIEVEVGRAEDTLLVPAMAVQADGPDDVVYIPAARPGDEPVAVPVKVGLSDGTDTEILSGLKEGDTVVVPLDSGPEGFFGAWLAAPGDGLT